MSRGCIVCLILLLAFLEHGVHVKLARLDVWSILRGVQENQPVVTLFLY
ncbi:hypothetical protein ACMZ7E_04215 [Gardnerella vaginalis]